jgi:hypothetical protein
MKHNEFNILLDLSLLKIDYIIFYLYCFETVINKCYYVLNFIFRRKKMVLNKPTNKPKKTKKVSTVDAYIKKHKMNLSSSKSPMKTSAKQVITKSFPVPEYLIAPKEVYQLWFEAYQQVQESNSKKIQGVFQKHKKYYKNWGSNSADFDQWWKVKAYLFEDKSMIQKIYKITKSPNLINLSVPTNKSMDTLVAQFKQTMKPILTEVKKTNPLKIKHQFAPTLNKGIKPTNIKLLLELNKSLFNNKSENKKELAYQVSLIANKPEYKLMAPASLIKYKELYENMKKSNTLIQALVKNADLKEMNNVKRYVNRYQQKVTKLLINVASGIFPGKY